MIVCDRANLLVLNAKWVIILGAAKSGTGKSAAKLNALHRRDTEDCRRHPILHAVGHMLAKAGLHTGNHALNCSANTVQIRRCGLNRLLHLCPGLIINHRERLPHGSGQSLHGGMNIIEPLILDFSH